MANFKITFLPVQTNVTRQFRNANQVDFFNQGTTDVTINSSRVIKPNTGFSMQAFPGEVDVTNYAITFAAPSADNNLLITIKEYC